MRDNWSPAERAEGLVGPKPTFELCAGWLTLLPTKGWTQPLPRRHFSNAKIRWPNNWHKTRNLKSFSLYAGDALHLRADDMLKFSRDQLGDLSYCVERNSELLFSAGYMINAGGPVALWQEYDMVQNRNPNDGQTIGRFRVAEQIPMIRPYVTVRLNNQIFHLLAGDDAFNHPYYLFLARSNYHHLGLHLMFGGGISAVYAAARLGEPPNGLTRQLVRDASHQLAISNTRIS